MDELDEGRRVQVLLADQLVPAAGAVGRQEDDQRPQALAPAVDDVFGDLVDEPDGAAQAGADH